MEFNDVEKKNEIDILVNECNQHILALWAAECVEHVIKYYTLYYPNDYRVHDAIGVAKGYAIGQTSSLDARRVALEANRASKEAKADNNIVAHFTAKAACQAASTAHIKIHAANAATSAVKAKAYSSAGDKAVVQKEREWQYKRLVQLQKPNNHN